jgi:hypothetical protein
LFELIGKGILMAKRQPKLTGPEPFFKQHTFWQKLAWGLVVVICGLFGYTYGYPIVAAGEPARGVLVGLAYGGGALIVILISYFLNRKLRGH